MPKFIDKELKHVFEIYMYIFEIDMHTQRCNFHGVKCQFGKIMSFLYVEGNPMLYGKIL